MFSQGHTCVLYTACIGGRKHLAGRKRSFSAWFLYPISPKRIVIAFVLDLGQDSFLSSSTTGPVSVLGLWGARLHPRDAILLKSRADES